MVQRGAQQANAIGIARPLPAGPGGLFVRMLGDLVLHLPVGPGTGGTFAADARLLPAVFESVARKHGVFFRIDLALALAAREIIHALALVPARIPAQTIAPELVPAALSALARTGRS